MADDKAKTPEAASKEATPSPPDSATPKTTVPSGRNTEKQTDVPAPDQEGISKESSLTDMVQQVKAAQEKQKVSIVNSKQHGKDIDRTSFVTFIRNSENKLNIPELNEEKKSFVITDLSKAKIVEKILSINPDEVITDAILSWMTPFPVLIPYIKIRLLSVLLSS